jgi:hypothetical protein
MTLIISFLISGFICAIVALMLWADVQYKKLIEEQEELLNRFSELDKLNQQMLKF